jgi:hypothetical protein
MKIVGSLITEADTDLAKDQKPAVVNAIKMERSPA